MADRSYKLTLSLSDGSTINAGTITAPQGPNGANGVTFTPSVSAAGVLSWTNNGGLTNPSPISIKGPKGDDAVITASDVEGWGFTKNAMPKSGGTFTGEVKFGSTENFQGYYIKRMLGGLGIGTRYADLDSSYKDGTWHRMWRLRFPSGSNFWGKIKITLYGGYSSFNASGMMSKSITCNFNTSNIYNNVGCYDGLGVNVEQDFRISEVIWNATVSAWEVLIWQKNLNGNNSPAIMLECWTRNDTNYINAFNSIAAQTVELTQSTSYSAQRASSTGGTKTVEWATLPVYENPLGEEIATIGDLSNKANLSGGNTFTGKQIFNSPGSDGYSINAAGYVKGSWLQASAIANKGANTGKVCVFDNSGWIYYRTPSEILAEAGGVKASDIVQATGTSTTSVMSQKATTDELAKKANLNSGNAFNGGQDFILPDGDIFYVSDSSDSTIFDVSAEEGVSIGRDVSAQILLSGNPGTSGQVLTSQGTGNTPVWKDIQVPDKAALSVPNAKVPMSGKWTSKTWGGNNYFGASLDIWTDGDYIYTSNGTRHYKLDKATSTWHITSWKGLTDFLGEYVWTDGNNIYYSNGNEQYILNKSTSTWSTKAWNGLTNFKGTNIWTDGNNIYYSNGNEQYILNKSTSTWSTKAWNGLTNFKAYGIWTDGNNIYYSNTTSAQYVLNKTTSTWIVKNWKGYTNLQGEYVWTDGDNIYYSIGSSHYVLDIATSTWNSKTWNGTNSNLVSGTLIWTDGDNIYCSNGTSTQLQLVKSTVANKTSINSDIKNIYTPITKIIGSNGTYVADSSGSVTLPSDSVASVVDLTGYLIGGGAYYVFNNGETGSFTGIIDCEYNTSAGDFQFEMNSNILTCTPASDGITLRVTIDRMYNGHIYYYYYTVVANDNSINTSGFFTDTNTDMYISTNMGSSYNQHGVGTIITKVV